MLVTLEGGGHKGIIFEEGDLSRKHIRMGLERKEQKKWYLRNSGASWTYLGKNIECSSPCGFVCDSRALGKAVAGP